MPTGRLALPHPQLARAIRSRARLAARGAGPAAAAVARTKASFAPRHGKAVEPGAWEQQNNESAQPLLPSVDAQLVSGKEYRRPEPDQQASQLEATQLPPDARPGGRIVPAEAAETSKAPGGRDGDEQTTRSISAAKNNRPLEAVLLMEPPEGSARQHQHPHMAPPPYVHHFDSYSLVKQLQEGGYTREQATTAMNGIRTLLAQNLDVAQQSLVSKSDVENETYLFTAACSELSTELKNNRRLQDEQMRQQRTLLQHEVDILTQSLNQELLTLNDNVRGMFNDRKMAAREEQKAAESAIQKITYKMSILLSSDCKSEIEGVRWILIRRSVLGIIFMAMLTLGMLRYATYVGQQRKLELERGKRDQEEQRKDAGKTDHSSAADAAAILAAT